jgi:hypothetical protein
MIYYERFAKILNRDFKEMARGWLKKLGGYNHAKTCYFYHWNYL